MTKTLYEIQQTGTKLRARDEVGSIAYGSRRIEMDVYNEDDGEYEYAASIHLDDEECRDLAQALIGWRLEPEARHALAAQNAAEIEALVSMIRQALFGLRDDVGTLLYQQSPATSTIDNHLRALMETAKAMQRALHGHTADDPQMTLSAAHSGVGDGDGSER